MLSRSMTSGSRTISAALSQGRFSCAGVDEVSPECHYNGKRAILDADDDAVYVHSNTAFARGPAAVLKGAHPFAELVVA